jgi:GntR family transcriptional regulator
VAAKLNLPEGAPVTEIQRVRLLNREPVSLELTWVPEALGKRLANADLATRDIFLILENECGVPLGHADVSIDAVLADEDIVRALSVEEGSPVLRIERLTHDASGKPIDYEHLYFRGDAFQYRLRIDREKVRARTRNKR